MEAISDPVIDSLTARYGAPKYAGHRMTKADFLNWESDDNYVYEFSDGVLEPTTSIKQNEVHFYSAIENRFGQTDAFRVGGRLRGEVDVWVTPKQMRRPDASYFSDSQLRQMAFGEDVVPDFMIEFVSEHDDARKYVRKLYEYFQAGTKSVWLIFPDDYTVYVYTSPKTVTICTDDDILSAAPALPDLQMTVAELFRK